SELSSTRAAFSGPSSRRTKVAKRGVPVQVWIGIAGVVALCFALCGGSAGVIYLVTRGNPNQVAQGSTPAQTPPSPSVMPTKPKVAPTRPDPNVDTGTKPDLKPALLNAPFTEKEARDAQATWAKYLGRKVEEEVDLGGGVKLELVLIPPGTFT